jgi:hypothetical protein
MRVTKKGQPSKLTFYNIDNLTGRHLDRVGTLTGLALRHT